MHKTNSLDFLRPVPEMNKLDKIMLMASRKVI